MCYTCYYPFEIFFFEWPLHLRSEPLKVEYPTVLVLLSVKQYQLNSISITLSNPLPRAPAKYRIHAACIIDVPIWHLSHLFSLALNLTVLHYFLAKF